MSRKTGKGKFECKICGKFLARKSTLYDHITALHEKGTKDLRCPVDGCGYRNTRKGNIHIHLMKAHGIELPIVKCFSKRCKIVKRREEGLIKHMRVCKHKPEFRTIRCQVKDCGAELLSFNGLCSHMKIHHSKNDNIYSADELINSGVKYFFE